MTLLVALKGSDGLVLAADSRGTFGDPRGVTAQNDSMQKAYLVAGDVAVLIAGSGEVGSLVLDRFTKATPKDQLAGVTDTMQKLREEARSAYNEWFPSLPPIQPMNLVATGQVATRPDLALLVAGLEPDGTPNIYQLHSSVDFAPTLNNYGFAVVGVPTYALYLLNRLYQGDRTVEELAALAVYVITETAGQDGKVGGPVKVVTVRPDEGCVMLDTPAVDVIVRSNEERSTLLRESFYKVEGS